MLVKRLDPRVQREESCGCNLFDAYRRGRLQQINTFPVVFLFVGAKLMSVVLSLLTAKCLEIYADIL